VSLVVENSAVLGRGTRSAAHTMVPAEAEYQFLLGPLIDAAKLARACRLAAQWGVQPHDVLIANGWLDADDYYRALAGTCGTLFKEALSPADAVPASKTTPQQCLATGLLKERAQSRRFVLAPERLRPAALRAMLSQLAPYDFALATPRAVRGAIYHHFAAILARGVTEDADLGTRLARAGYRCRVIASTTYEEAPRSFMSWVRQRTRWLKGFVQTWLVHMRAPAKLWRELGPRGFLAFQVMVGGTVLSALVHPWFYALVVYELFGGSGFLARPAGLPVLPFWTIAWFDLISGYLAAMALGLIAVRRRGLGRLSWQILLMPAYWLLISAAAYRAVWKFMTAPFKWEKTDHVGPTGAGNEGDWSG